MKISITLTSNSAGAVTRTPSWLARWLLGREVTTVGAMFVRRFTRDEDTRTPRYGWVYGDGRDVEPAVVDAIDRALTLRSVRARRKSIQRC